MKRKRLFILLVCFGCTTCGGRPSGTIPEFNSDELVGAWVDMWNSYNLSKVDSLFVTDLTAIYFSSEREGLIRGIEAIREHHVGFGFVEGGKTQGNRLGWRSCRPISSDRQRLLQVYGISSARAKRAGRRRRAR